MLDSRREIFLLGEGQPQRYPDRLPRWLLLLATSTTSCLQVSAEQKCCCTLSLEFSGEVVFGERRVGETPVQWEIFEEPVQWEIFEDPNVRISGDASGHCRIVDLFPTAVNHLALE